MTVCIRCKGHGVTRYVFKCKHCSAKCYLCENIKISKKMLLQKFDLIQIKLKLKI